VNKYTFHHRQYDILNITTVRKQEAIQGLAKSSELLEEKLPYWFNDIALNVAEIQKSDEIDSWTKSKVDTAFKEIEAIIDGSDNWTSIYSLMNKYQTIWGQFTSSKPKVWRICSVMDKLFPELIKLEKTMDIHFSLRDSEFENIAETLERVEVKSSEIEKCNIARSAYENIVKRILEKEGETPAQGFYSNIDKLKKLDIIMPVDRKTLGAHYSFISQIIHLEKKDDSQNVLYAINGVYRNIDFLLTSYLKFKKQESTENQSDESE